jgi:hypothetical protein
MKMYIIMDWPWMAACCKNNNFIYKKFVRRFKLITLSRNVHMERTTRTHIQYNSAPVGIWTHDFLLRILRMSKVLRCSESYLQNNIESSILYRGESGGSSIPGKDKQNLTSSRRLAQSGIHSLSCQIGNREVFLQVMEPQRQFEHLLPSRADVQDT